MFKGVQKWSFQKATLCNERDVGTEKTRYRFKLKVINTLHHMIFKTKILLTIICGRDPRLEYL
jgi:hypothetical protein